MTPPASQRAEEALLGAILRDPSVTGEVLASMLESGHFFFRPYRIVFEEVEERSYADDTIDSLLIAEAVQRRVAEAWKCSEREAVDRVMALKDAASTTPTVELAGLVKRHHDYRELLTLSERLRDAVNGERDDPDVIASETSAHAMRIATDMVIRHEVHSYGDLGRRWVQTAKTQMAIVQSGRRIGAHFRIRAIDDFTKGLKPTELLIAGGEPGVGKSAVWWKAGENFAQEQEPLDERIGTLILSLEMGEEPSSTRLAQSVGGVDGEKLRMGTLSREELINTARAWARKKDLPLFVNHSGHLRHSQLRAIVVEEVRKHNVGVVIIDHFKFLKPDDRSLTGADADDETVVFLKAMAKDLNIAVICLAHTVKAIERADKRPRMSDLRGSGMISAFADFVCFIYRPWKHASDKQRAQGMVSESDAEMLWEKTRHTGEGSSDFYMNLSTMTIY